VTAASEPGSASWTLREIDFLLRGVPGARSEELPLLRLLEREATILLEAHRTANPSAGYLIRGSKYQPGRSEISDAEILAAALPEEKALACMVRWHWFEDLSEMRPHATEIVDPHFESACDAIVDGDVEALRSLLAKDRSLVHARPPFAHHQTLLQHVAANGIEHSRQWHRRRTP
jgi:hypothetical protein